MRESRKPLECEQTLTVAAFVNSLATDLPIFYGESEVRVMRSREFLFVVAAILVFVSVPAAANDPVDAAAAAVGEKYQLNIKKLFATKCSWCHQGYGMVQADGPRLAGNTKTIEQLSKHINEGKSPMPSFKNQLSEKEVQALAEYIKALPAN